MSANHNAHAAGLAAEAAVFEEPPHVKGGVVRPNVERHQAVSRMTQRGIKEASVLCEQRDAAKLVKQGIMSGSLVPSRATSRPIFRKRIRHA